MGSLGDSDLSFIEKFETLGFGKECWTHEAHLRMAWIQLSRADFATSLERIRVGIQAFNNSVGSVGYHETVTVAFTRIIHFRMGQFPAEHTWTEFLADNLDLLSKETPILSKYYSPSLLTGEVSKARFVNPDRKALPPVGQVRNVREDDATAIVAIYAPSIIDSYTSFEFTVPSERQMRERIADHVAHAPWLVYEVEGRVVGYAYASKHRAREAYQWTVEVSAYIDKGFHQKGIARVLYSRLFRELKKLGFQLALAGVTLPNDASVGFHEAMGFMRVGTYRNIGFKLGKWLDVVWYERLLGDLDPNPKPIGTNFLN